MATQDPTGTPKKTNLGKIVPTPIPEKKDTHAILDIVAVAGRAYISRKDNNTAPVTDAASWLKLTENDYDMATRLGLFEGTEQEWIASLSAASETAAEEARAATAESKKATAAANRATSDANSSSASARASAQKAGASAADTDLVRAQALAAVEILRQMIEEGRSEILNMQAIQELVVSDVQLSPSRMEVEFPARITITNTVAQKIDARIFPSYLVQNVIFQHTPGGGESVAVNPDGNLEIRGCGKTRIHVIAANNTRLFRTIEIEVKEPDIRITNAGGLRLNSDGTIRLA